MERGTEPPIDAEPVFAEVLAAVSPAGRPLGVNQRQPAAAIRQASWSFPPADGRAGAGRAAADPRAAGSPHGGALAAAAAPGVAVGAVGQPGSGRV